MWTQKKIQATWESVLKKANEDLAFREKLKSNPKEALAEEAGEMIPDAVRIVVLDQNDVDFVITLPRSETGELSDMDLEHVAGGDKGNVNPNCQFDFQPSHKGNDGRTIYYVKNRTYTYGGRGGYLV